MGKQGYVVGNMSLISCEYDCQLDKSFRKISALVEENGCFISAVVA